MRREDLEKIFLGEVQLINLYRLDGQDTAKIEKIIVAPLLIKEILYKYLNQQLSSEDLQKWADFIYFHEVFVDADFNNNPRKDFYENMWYVVQRISTPYLDGDIIPERIKAYINELEENYGVRGRL